MPQSTGPALIKWGGLHACRKWPATNIYRGAYRREPGRNIIVGRVIGMLAQRNPGGPG
jgi:hypothetical protein